MTATITDLFCGAGGSSLGATAAGATLVMAANHWQTAIEVHQAHFPDAGHDCADISQADPRRYPRTNILLASPECTNHSQARGVSRRRQDPTLWDAPDPAAERSRATMWDVPRFAEQMRYDAVVVENVVEATKWVMWPAWWQAMELLGYRGTVLSHNSMHHGVPQSRDRIFVVWLRAGLTADLEMERDAHCPRCDTPTMCRQAWKPGRRVGRYRQQWVWACTRCAAVCEPSAEPAASIIDWALPCPRIGDRDRALAPATRTRIAAGLQRYGWAGPITTSGAGNVHERTPGNRARPVTEPLPVQQTNFGNVPTSVLDPLPTATTGNRHALVVPYNGTGQAHDASEPLGSVTTTDRHALVVPMRRNGHAAPTTAPVPTVTAGGQHHALLMRNNTARGDPGQMVTPVTEPARTITTKGHQSLILPAPGVDLDHLVDDCGFRMLEPYEVAAAMAFPEHYIPRTLPKKDQVKLAGNAVTPPVMTWIVGRVLQALEAAS